MKIFRLCLFLFFLFAIQNGLHAVTLVYSLRIRRAFNLAPVLQQTRTRWPFSVVPIFYARNSQDLIDVRTNTTVDEKRRVGAVLLNLRCVPNKNWFFEGTTAIDNEHASFKGPTGFKASRTALDDMVFAGGYRHFCGENVQFVGYGLAGFPMGRGISLEDTFTPLVGTRLFSLGVGGEASYSFVSELTHSCAAIFQGRFIHAFNRSWFPILPEGSKIQPGNVSDLFFILQTRYYHTVFEFGYDLTLFTNQALIFPTQTVDAKTQVRHGAEVSVSHGWLKTPLGKPIVLNGGISATHSKKFNSNTVTVWLNGTIVF